MQLVLLIRNEKPTKKASFLAVSSSQSPGFGAKFVHKGLKFMMGWLSF